MRKSGGYDGARGFAFRVLHTDAGNRNVARFTCVECGDCLDVTNSNSGKVAEWFVARANREGWAASAHNRNKCYCPRCLNDAKAKYMAPSLEKTSASVIALRPVPQPAQEGAPVSAAKQQIGQPRDPSTDERLRIRTRLDKCFDDAEGVYLDGMSDQEIGRLENIPWAIVTKIRETAYGPIRTDPELARLRAQMAELLDRVDQMRAALDAYGRKQAA